VVMVVCGWLSTLHAGEQLSGNHLPAQNRFANPATATLLRSSPDLTVSIMSNHCPLFGMILRPLD
jgi:hypothetical protein